MAMTVQQWIAQQKGTGGNNSVPSDPVTPPTQQPASQSQPMTVSEWIQKQQTNPAVAESPTPVAPATPVNRFLKGIVAYPGNVSRDVSGAVKQGVSDLSANSQVATSNANPVQKLGSSVMAGLNLAGDTAAGVAAPITDAVAPIVGGAINAIPGGSKVVGSLGSFAQGLTKKNPLAARAVEDVANVATLPIGGAEGDIVIGTLKSGAKDFGASLAARATEKEIPSIAETISPKLTTKETTEALAKRGATKKGLLGKISLNPDPYVNKVAKTVKEIVPDFNPKKSLSENITATQKALGNEAEDLKNKVIVSGKNRLYSYRDLGSRLKNIEKPVLISSDRTLDSAYDSVVNKAMEIAQKNGGKISSLLDTRKEFDSFVSKQFPNMYSSETLTPMRTAIKSVRDEMNSFIEENLPKDIGFKKSLTQQSHLYDAIDNMSSKAASGADKEIGTNAVQRFAKDHPLATRLAKSAAGGVATIAGYEGLKKELPFLP